MEPEININVEKKTEIVTSYGLSDYNDLLHFIKSYNLDPEKDQIHFQIDYSEVYYEGEQPTMRAWAEIPSDSIALKVSKRKSK